MTEPESLGTQTGMYEAVRSLSDKANATMCVLEIVQTKQTEDMSSYLVLLEKPCIDGTLSPNPWPCLS
jgi:hypothetical protein